MYLYNVQIISFYRVLKNDALRFLNEKQSPFDYSEKNSTEQCTQQNEKWKYCIKIRICLMILMKTKYLLIK